MHGSRRRCSPDPGIARTYRRSRCHPWVELGPPTGVSDHGVPEGKWLPTSRTLVVIERPTEVVFHYVADQRTEPTCKPKCCLGRAGGALELELQLGPPLLVGLLGQAKIGLSGADLLDGALERVETQGIDAALIQPYGVEEFVRAGPRRPGLRTVHWGGPVRLQTIAAVLGPPSPGHVPDLSVACRSVELGP